MKLFNSLLIVSLIVITHSSLLFAAAAKSSGHGAAGAQAALIDVSTRFGKSLNDQLKQLATPPSEAIAAKINAVLVKGKELHLADKDFAIALEAAAKEKKEHEIQTIKMGRTCFITSTINPVKALTAEYRATKAQNCANFNAQFPDSHEKFASFPQGSQLQRLTKELYASSQELFDSAPVEVQQVVGKQLAEIDTLGNLINHLAPSE
jgi:hypothetical protein